MQTSFGKLVESSTWMIFKSINEAARTLGIYPASISQCARGVTAETCGYVFSFKDCTKIECDKEQWEEFVVTDWMPGGKYHVSQRSKGF